MAERFKLIVLDDDPTGSQTVHSCPLLLCWDAGSLRRGLAHPSPLLFVLANTRALGADAASARVREICRALKSALAWAKAAGHLDRWMVVSRGDSTLRGHFPLEVEVLHEELGPFDSTFLAPAFLPGGRTTVDGVHLLDGQPVHTTPFARDRLFGYSTSDLPAWVEQKSAGRIPATSVPRLTGAELDAAASDLEHRLQALPRGCVVAVDGQRIEQLQALGTAIHGLSRQGRRFTAQCAASLINGLVPLPPQPLSAKKLAALRRRDALGQSLPGLVMVGSHVPLADAQLERLLQEPACAGLELPVARLAEAAETAWMEAEWLEQLQERLRAGTTPVLYTSRGELSLGSEADRRRLGLGLAALMARLVGALAPQLGYVISKGGITSQMLLTNGLGASVVALQGQLMPGLSMVLVDDLPVVTFPGNLGGADGLCLAWRAMDAAEIGSDS
jgi:uncharacterized protein YgbK (DUF1537 family)